MSPKDLSNAQNQEKCVAAGQVCQNEVEEAYQLITEKQWFYEEIICENIKYHYHFGIRKYYTNLQNTCLNI